MNYSSKIHINQPEIKSKPIADMEVGDFFLGSLGGPVHMLTGNDLVRNVLTSINLTTKDTWSNSRDAEGFPLVLEKITFNYA